MSLMYQKRVNGSKKDFELYEIGRKVSLETTLQALRRLHIDDPQAYQATTLSEGAERAERY